MALAVGGAAGVAGQDMGTGGQAGQGGRGGQGGAVVAAMTAEQYDELLQLPYSHSPVEPLNFLIDSGSDISLCCNYDLFTFVEPCDLKSCTPVGSTPLSIHGVGVVRFCLGSYVDHLRQMHPHGDPYCLVCFSELVQYIVDHSFQAIVQHVLEHPV